MLKNGGTVMITSLIGCSAYDNTIIKHIQSRTYIHTYTWMHRVLTTITRNNTPHTHTLHMHTHIHTYIRYRPNAKSQALIVRD